MAIPKSTSRRNSDLAMIHIAAKRLFGDVSKGGDGREDYEDWLEGKTGKRSAGKLALPERIDLVKALRKDGLIPNSNRDRRSVGGAGQTAGDEDRPTKPQWNKIGGLARDMGWDRGLADSRLHGFVERTAKVTNAKFLTRKQASKVISGLENWVRQRKDKGDAVS